ncbi:hypothetical protein TNCV_5108951 [Trichonephila clavipes]|nr:hypothetical protein TNCV_5108951 [Trichonephila clavipes]
MNKSVREGDAPPFGNFVQPAESLSVPSFVCFRFSLWYPWKGKGRRTAADSVQSEWPLWHAAKSKNTIFARRRS